ncbi:MAG: HAD family phosphatase [Spirochaetales bacterium]|nr:HAD family phosphatase [Spirochaetales bacterium]
MNYKLIAFDMDDTLLNGQGKMSKENHDALDDLVSQGVQIVLCSGRPTSVLLGNARALLGEKQGEYIISFNGGVVCSVATGEELVRIPMLPEGGKIVLEAARKKGVLVQAYLGSDFYVEIDDPRAQKYSQGLSMAYSVVNDLMTIINQGSLKLLLNGPREKLLEIEKELTPLAPGNFTMAFSKPEYLEFVHPQVHKGTGIEALARILGLSVDQTIGVGDSYNDIEMLRTAGLGIAVANAKPEVKEVADIVLDSSNEESIVLEIRRRFFDSQEV